jgi:SAM-dependent methyltransferase
MTMWYDVARWAGLTRREDEPAGGTMAVPHRVLAEDRIPFLDADFYALLAKELGKGRLLDFGCDTGNNMQPFFARGWECVGIDVNSRALQQASQYGQTILRRGEEPLASLADESFDLVVANAVFHHLENVGDNLAELIRCVKPGKLLIINEVVEDNFLMRQARNVFKAWHGIPIKSRMFVRDWLQLFKTSNLNILRMYGQKHWISYAVFVSSFFPTVLRRNFRRCFTRRRIAVSTAQCKQIMFVMFVVEKA